MASTSVRLSNLPMKRGGKNENKNYLATHTCTHTLTAALSQIHALHTQRFALLSRLCLTHIYQEVSFASIVGLFCFIVGLFCLYIRHYSPAYALRIYIRSVTSSECHIIIHSVTSSYIMSHHHALLSRLCLTHIHASTLSDAFMFACTHARTRAFFMHPTLSFSRTVCFVHVCVCVCVCTYMYTCIYCNLLVLHCIFSMLIGG
jgi:hypothetical protein